MVLTINTNGTLLDEEWADFFAENRPRRIILRFTVQMIRRMRRSAITPEDLKRHFGESDC